jgi:hypothetical protein
MTVRMVSLEYVMRKDETKVEKKVKRSEASPGKR